MLWYRVPVRPCTVILIKCYVADEFNKTTLLATFTILLFWEFYFSWIINRNTNVSINLMFVVPYFLVIYMFNSDQTKCTLYSLFLSSLALHVSGAIWTHHPEHNCRVQPKVVYVWKTEVLVSSGVDAPVPAPMGKHTKTASTQIAQETTQYQGSNDTHAPAQKYHARLWKTSNHKSIQNKHPHHLILKPLFSTDTKPMAVRGSCASDDGCK
jgi:hypothetical protein